MGYAIASTIVPASPRQDGTRDGARPPAGGRWTHVATFRDEFLCRTTGQGGLADGSWAGFTYVLNDEYGAWDLHVRLDG